MKGRVGWRGLLLAVFACVVVFTRLGGQGLIEPDEGRYASIAREMADGGSWLIPHLNGIPHFQKPPIIYWSTALAFRCFAANEAAARLPSALAALGILALTFAIGRKLYGVETGIGAVLILVAALEFFGHARMLTPDMMMSFWITAAVFCLVKHRLDGRRRWGWFFFVAMGLGFLTKGPMALVVPLSAAVVWRLAAGPSGRGLPWVPGMALTLAISLSWFVTLVVQEPQLRSYFLGYELVQRFTSHVHGRSKPVWFFVPVLLVGLLPWSPGLLAMVGTLVRRWREGWRPAPNAWLLAGWFMPPLLVLSVSGSKLLTYVIPLFPPLAIALAQWELQWHRTARVAHAVSAIILALAAVGAWLAHRWIPDADLAGLAVPFLLVGLGLAIAATFRRLAANPVAALACISVTTAAGWLWAMGQADRVNNFLGAQASIRALAQQVLNAPDLDRATFFVVDARLHSWEFYLRRTVSVSLSDSDVVLPLTAEQKDRLLPNPKESAALLEGRAPAYGLVGARTFATRFPTNNWAVLGRAGAYYLIATRDAALAQPGSPSTRTPKLKETPK